MMACILKAVVTCESLSMMRCIRRLSEPLLLFALLLGTQLQAALSDSLATEENLHSTESYDTESTGHTEVVDRQVIIPQGIYAYSREMTDDVAYPFFYRDNTEEREVGIGGKSPQLRGYKRIFLGGLLALFGLVAAASLINRQLDFGDEVNEELGRFGYEIDDSVPLKTRQALENLDMIVNALGIALFGTLCFVWGLFMRSKSKQEAVLWLLRQMTKDSRDDYIWHAVNGEEEPAVTTAEGHS